MAPKLLGRSAYLGHTIPVIVVAVKDWLRVVGARWQARSKSAGNEMSDDRQRHPSLIENLVACS